jgi:hypothetical protein
MELKLEEGNVRPNITNRDLDVYMSFGFVVRCRMGSLISLRAQLTKMFDESFNYPTLSSSPLFVVHWNDLCETKKRELESKR